MTEIVSIPLNKLDADPKNVRKTYTAESLESLASSILANGLIQNIVVRKAPRGRFLVTAGGRRRAALLLLADRREIAADFGVSAIVKDAAEATEISLTENVMREPMHPADQFEAFKALVDEGKPIKDIAARFGTTEIIVNRRLALAKVSPALFAAFRAEDMTFEQLAAFTITDDHARQEEVWRELPNWDRTAQTIKRRLTTDEVPASDKRVTLIGGLEVYEAAGGPVRRDLFSDNGGGFACDSGLLEKLVAEKLNAEAETVKAEGWKWVECALQQPDNIYQMGRVYPQRIDLSEEDQAKLNELNQRYDELAAQIEAEEGDEAAEAALSDIEQEIAALQKAEEAFQSEDLLIAGAIVTIDHWGKLALIRGLVRDEDRKKAQAPASHGKDDTSDGESAPKGATLTQSAALIEDLTAQKTAALRVELANNAEIALVAVVHATLLKVQYRAAYGIPGHQSALEISVTHEALDGSMKRPAENRALEAWGSLEENYGYKLPGDPADLWEWLMDQSQGELLHLLAYAAAHSVNAVERKFNSRKDALAHADQIGRALDVDMRDWFETTAESYFSHVNRPTIRAVVAEVRGDDFAAGIAGMKKGEAVEYAAKAIKDSGWLPPHVRIAPDPNAEDEAQAEAAPAENTLPMAAE
jgi:ParB family chromosome partitioning protein